MTLCSQVSSLNSFYNLFIILRVHIHKKKTHHCLKIKTNLAKIKASEFFMVKEILILKSIFFLIEAFQCHMVALKMEHIFDCICLKEYFLLI